MWKTSHYHPFTAPGWVIVGVAGACVMTGMLVGGWRMRSIWWHLSAWVAPSLANHPLHQQHHPNLHQHQHAINEHLMLLIHQRLNLFVTASARACTLLGKSTLISF